jgi:hypothetical protein
MRLLPLMVATAVIAWLVYKLVTMLMGVGPAAPLDLGV